MPKTAILTDIHANLPALEAVLREVDASGVDGIAFGGDLVGYGASPAECVERVRAAGGRSVRGNHDEYTRQLALWGVGMPPEGRRADAVRAGIGLAVSQMSEEALTWLWGLPMNLELDGGAVLAHASLHDPAGWHYLTNETDAAPTFALLQQRGGERGVGFFGHTHQIECLADPTAPVQPQWITPNRVHLPEGAVCAILSGSVGQPRHRTDFRASWVIWDGDAREVEIRRTAYPAMEAAQAIAEAGLPIESALRLLSAEQFLQWLSS
jgi:diadenosine tetraphosphatase ApaH/serine/threonine PP2A family protein phosphatase